MDKKFSDALLNFAASLDLLVESIREMNETKKNEKKENKFSGLFSGGNSLNKKVEEINKGIQDIKKDTNIIKRGQQTIIGMLNKMKSPKNNVTPAQQEQIKQPSTITAIVKDKKKQAKEAKNKFLEMFKGDSKGFKDAAKNVVIMAGAILAIGLALKVVGKVDFASVIALSIALPMMAIAFDKISQIKGLDMKTMLKTGMVLVVMSIALVASSFILSYIQPVGLAQLITAFGITAAFVLMSYGIGSLAKGVKNIDAKGLIMLPLVLVTMSMAILAASYILAGVNPIAPGNLGNIILMAGTLTLVGIVMSLGFWVMDKLLTAKSLLFGSMSSLVIASVIAISSFILAKGNYGNAPSLGWAVGAAVAMTLFAIPVAILGFIGLPVVAMGAAGLVLIAGAIALSSVILAKVKPDFFYKMADVMSYFMKKMAEAIGYGLTVIAPGLSAFLTAIEKPLSDFINNALPAISQAIKAIGDVISSVGNSIANVINSVFSGIVNTITAITDSITRLSNISGAQLIGVAGGITAVGASLAVFGTSSFIGGVLGGLGKLVGGDTLGQFIKLAQNSKGLTDAGNSLEKIAKSIKGFNGLNNVNTDPIKKLIDFFSDKSVVSGIITGQLAMDRFSGSVDKVGTSVNKLADGLAKLKNVDLNDIKVVNNTIASLAVVDPGNLNSVLDVINKQADALNNLFDKVASRAAENNKPVEENENLSPSLNINSSGANKNRTLNDLYALMADMNTKLSSISDSNSSIAEAAEDMRSVGFNGIRH